MDQNQHDAPKMIIRSPSKKTWGIIGIVVGIVLITAAAFWALSPRSPFSSDIAESVSFPLYYPTKFPTNYTIDQSSISSNNQAVLYRIINTKNNGRTIFVSIQAKPDGMNFDDFYNHHLTNPVSHVTSNGSVVIGQENNGTLGGLLTDKVWIIVTSADETASDRILTILASLQKA